VYGRRIGSEQDLFRVEGIERASAGAFATTHQVINDFLDSSEEFVRGFAMCCFSRNEHIPTV
jgi:hypothetical protein